MHLLHCYQGKSLWTYSLHLHKLLQKPGDRYLRTHIISAFVAIDDLNKTSRVDWNFEELVAQLSLFTSSSSGDTTFSLGFAKKQVIDFAADWCFLPKNRREKSVGNKEWR